MFEGQPETTIRQTAFLESLEQCRHRGGGLFYEVGVPQPYRHSASALLSCAQILAFSVVGHVHE